MKTQNIDKVVQISKQLEYLQDLLKKPDKDSPIRRIIERGVWFFEKLDKCKIDKFNALLLEFQQDYIKEIEQL